MRTLTKVEYDKLLTTSNVIEEDRHGVKVLELADGHFLKTFWYRRVVSSRRIYPEWLRFSLHDGALKRRRIPTVTVLETLRIPHLNRTGVIYLPLEGRTLRQVAEAGEFDEVLAGRFGGFLADLHFKGILFKSLHLGNVLLGSDGNFGLIDISDMKVFLWPLSTGTRLRNFVHLFRYSGDFKILTENGLPEFTSGYLNRCSSARLKRGLHQLCEKWGDDESGVSTV